MNAKEMLARYAQGGMVDESVDVSKARQMLQNLTSPVQHFASGSEVVPAGFRRSLFTGELVPIAATVEQLTDIYRGGEAQQANADAAARAVAAAATPVQAGPAVSAAPAPETRLSLFTNEPVPVNASVQDLTDVYSDYSFPTEPAAPETRLSLFTNEPVPVNASVQDLTDIYSDYSFPTEPAAPETRLSLFTNEPVPVNASVQDLTDIYSDYSFPSEPAASTTTASPSTVAQDIATLSSVQKQPSTAASDLLDLSKVASPAPGPSAAAVTSATIGDPPTSQGPDAVALASELGIPTFQVVSLLNQGLDASAIRNRYAIPVSVATDLMQRSMTGGVDTSEFDRLGGYERVKEVYDAAGGSYTPPFGQKPVVPTPVPPIVPTPAPSVVPTPAPSVVLPPPQPLPPLTEEFVAPTAPLPEAPPVALTPGQEGLDPSTAIVGATPVENRVARVTETAINKIPESERVKIPQLDTEFRASAPRTATYDRFGRITGYNYSPAAKLTPATGTNVFNFVPPGITSRPRSLLNIGDVPGVTVDPVTGQMTMPLSASQRFARDRAELDNQFRRLYARAAEADTSLPTQAPSTAAAAFRQFAMNDPTMSAQLRMRNIEQTPTVSPTAAMTAARSEYGAAPYAAALAEAFDPFLARNRAALLASKDMQKSYFERYPDLVAEYEKNWSKTMSPEEYAAYHYRTLGQKEGRTPPNLMGSPYTQQFFSKGGEASTEDFIKKQSGGDVSRETASPNTAEVPQVDTEGRLIDENAEMRSESQRMLNRLKTAQQESYRRGKLPQKNEDAEKVRKDIREGMRALVGMGPYDETNPTEAYRIAATPTPLAAVGMIGRKGLLGMLDKARGSTAFKGRGLDVAEAEQFSVKELMNRLKQQGIDVDRTWLRGKKDPGGGFEKPPTYEYLEAVYEYQKRPDAIELALRDAKQGRPWSRAGTVSRQPGDRDVTKANTKGGVWLTESPTIAESYSGDSGFIIPVLTRRPKVVLDAKGEQWDEFFETSKEFKEAQKDPNVKSIEVKNIIDFGGRSKLPSGLSDDELRKLLTANNLFLKKPFVDKDVVSKLTGEPFPYQDGGPVNVPRETSTSKQQLDKLAQVSQRKKA